MAKKVMILDRCVRDNYFLDIIESNLISLERLQTVIERGRSIENVICYGDFMVNDKLKGSNYAKRK